MKAFSTFSGIGGFELGFQQAGIPLTWVGYSEIDPYATKIYNTHFSHKNYGDITPITTNLPDFDILTGGFPCQSFSPNGERHGFNDTNGQVFFDLVRILKDKKPQFFLLENVKGLLSHDHGKTFQTVIKTLSSLGYSIEWQVLNSADYGVPQGRERVYIIGYHGKLPTSPVFPFIRANGSIIRGTQSTRNQGITNGKTSKMRAVLTPGKNRLRPGPRRFKRPGEPMFTLTVGDRHGIYDGSEFRKLTVTEQERLQGFPDGWTATGKKDDGTFCSISNSQRMNCLGNAVTVNVVEAIARRLFPIFPKVAKTKNQRSEGGMCP